MIRRLRADETRYEPDLQANTIYYSGLTQTTTALGSVEKCMIDSATAILESDCCITFGSLYLTNPRLSVYFSCGMI